MTLTVVRSPSQVFYRMPLNLNLSDVFLRIRIRLAFYDSEDNRSDEVSFPSHHIRGHGLNMKYHGDVKLLSHGYDSVCQAFPL